jgi:putative transcriptional regulator
MMVKRDEQDFGEMLIQGMREALAISRGEMEPARVNRRALSAREAEAPPPSEYEAADVRRIRERMGLSQHVFAQMLNVSVDTVKAWERGTRQAAGPSLRLLEVAEDHPEVLLGILGRRPRSKNGEEAPRKPVAKRPRREAA